MYIGLDHASPIATWGHQVNSSSQALSNLDCKATLSITWCTFGRNQRHPTFLCPYSVWCWWGLSRLLSALPTLQILLQPDVLAYCRRWARWNWRAAIPRIPWGYTWRPVESRLYALRLHRQENVAAIVAVLHCSLRIIAYTVLWFCPCWKNGCIFARRTNSCASKLNTDGPIPRFRVVLFFAEPDQVGNLRRSISHISRKIGVQSAKFTNPILMAITSQKHVVTNLIII